MRCVFPFFFLVSHFLFIIIAAETIKLRRVVVGDHDAACVTAH